MVEISFYNVDFDNTSLIKNLKRIIELILDDYNKRDYDLSLVVCDNAFIHNLNKEYRGKDLPTDVLSFSQEDGEDFKDFEFSTPVLGDIIISADKAIEQAKEYGVTGDEEFARLAIHGTLHLLGLNHDTEAEEEEMLGLQDIYLDKFLVFIK
jgi:probable rRNA maturation factor